MYMAVSAWWYDNDFYFSCNYVRAKEYLPLEASKDSDIKSWIVKSE